MLCSEKKVLIEQMNWGLMSQETAMTETVCASGAFIRVQGPITIDAALNIIPVTFEETDMVKC